MMGDMLIIISKGTHLNKQQKKWSVVTKMLTMKASESILTNHSKSLGDVGGKCRSDDVDGIKMHNQHKS